MITAKEARELINQNNPVNKEITNLLHVIDMKIKDACNDGYDRLILTFNEYKYIIHLAKVVDELRLAGFTTQYNCETWRNDPYATLDISW